MSNIWTVRAQGATQDLIMDGSGTFPAFWMPVPVAVRSQAGYGKGIEVSVGSSSFAGNLTNTMTTSVGHGLGAIPDFVSIFPALTSGSTFWAAEVGQANFADATSFYPGAYTPVGTFAAVTYYFNWLALKLL
jgi:hypothetical protein